MRSISRTHPLRRLFASVSETTFFGELGMPNPRLVDYIADLLTRFVHVDNLYRIRDARGRPLDQVADMLLEGDVRLNARSFNREREVHRHVGDFTLFWTGAYPEALARLREPTRKDHLVDYVTQGKKSYAIAASFRYGPYAEEAAVLAQLSDYFELCAYGLHRVRERWETLATAHAARTRKQLLGE